ncbi:DUF2637 domain-containing protein [Streptomyces sp. NPDC059513]|uniref:DUF2637 domain-containing protein n=1 Tax=unclassified Streptomyces TaxID=2593676 RepID=UPI00367C7AE2
MNKTKIMQWGGFALVLIVALAISWYSMATLAMDFFHLPEWIAYAVSVAFDGAAIYVAVLSSEYAKTEDSGLMPRLVTMGMVGVSAWLNWQHASLMGLGLAGQVFFAAPPVIAGILFELMLRFENRQELRKRGRVAQSMPVLGRLAWLRFPSKTFKAWSSVVLYRLNKTTAEETETQDIKPVLKDKTPKTKTVDMVKTPKRVLKTETPSAKDMDKAFPELSSDQSIAQLVQQLYSNGVKDRSKIQQKVSSLKGVDVPMNTVHRAINRMK